MGVIGFIKFDQVELSGMRDQFSESAFLKSLEACIRNNQSC